jgi:hypothetical protein
MSIFYKINDIANSNTIYIVTDNYSYNILSSNNINNIFWGSENDANNILESSKEYYISLYPEYNINKTVVNDDNTHTWLLVADYTQEQFNNDVIYNVLNVPNGDIIQTIGTNNLITLLNTIDNQYLNFIYGEGNSSIITMNTNNIIISNGFIRVVKGI